MAKPFRTQITIGEESKVVEIHEDAQGVFVVVDGQRRTLSATQRTASKHQEIFLDGDLMPFGVMPTSGGFEVVIDGTVYDAKVADPRASHYAGLVKAPKGASRELIKAPMPGMIVSVLVDVGDEIVKGQTVLTLNAMKLENDIRASKGGVVKETWARPEMAVEKGAKLLLIE